MLAAAFVNPFPARQHWRIRGRGLLRFIPAFLAFSLRSAIEIGWRAVHPRCPLNPTLLDYTWRLPDNSSRVFLANLINLMPGTLCVRITEHAMTVHSLGDTERTLHSLITLEHLVAGLLDQPLDEPSETTPHD